MAKILVAQFTDKRVMFNNRQEVFEFQTSFEHGDLRRWCRFGWCTLEDAHRRRPDLVNLLQLALNRPGIVS